MHKEVVLYLTPRDLNERLRGMISVRTLANWRCLGIGPRFTKAGGRILYPISAVEEWEKSSTVESTADYGRTG